MTLEDGRERRGYLSKNRSICFSLFTRLVLLCVEEAKEKRELYPEPNGKV